MNTATMPPRTIRLYGELGKRFGKKHILYVRSVGEAARALCVNFKGFKQFLEKEKYAGYEVWDGKYNVDSKDEDFNKLGDGDIKIIPRIRGGSNTAKIIAGVIFVAIVTWATWGTGGPWAAGTAAGWTAAANFGVSLIMSGVIGMMTKTSLGGTVASDEENSESYIFSGPANSTKQGNPVYIGYGEMVVGSQVVSAALTTNDM